ncbi:hypothetical protein NWF32_00110 [Pseudomonas qingdaonensis]|nr:hypothetical protein [Pseudomonas qingdaonensis]
MRVFATQHPVPMLPGTTTEDGKSFIPADPESPVQVEEHAYYSRRIAAGELRRAGEKSGAVEKSSAKKAAQNEEAKA